MYKQNTRTAEVTALIASSGVRITQTEFVRQPKGWRRRRRRWWWNISKLSITTDRPGKVSVGSSGALNGGERRTFLELALESLAELKSSTRHAYWRTKGFQMDGVVNITIL